MDEESAGKNAGFNVNENFHKANRGRAAGHPADPTQIPACDIIAT